MTRKNVKKFICFVMFIFLLSLNCFALNYQVENKILKSFNPSYMSYTGDYELLSKSGNESLYDISFEDFVIVDGVDEFGENITHKEIKVCMKASFDTKFINNSNILEPTASYDYSVPIKMKIQKGEGIFKTTSDLDRELVKYSKNVKASFETGDTYKFCYQADPFEEIYLKFGENSIVVVSETVANVDAVLSNVTAEGNFSHLSLNDTSIKLYMPFDSNISSTTVYDYSENNNDGTINGAVFNSSGKIGGAYSFDGDDYIVAPDSASLSMGDIDFTVSTWVKLNSKPSNAGVVAKINDGTVGGEEWVIQYNGGGTDRFRFVVWNSGGGATAVTANNFGAPTLGEWVYIVASHTAATSTISISVNAGTANTQGGAVTPFDGANSLMIGAERADSPTRFLTGSIDEVKIDKRLLNSTEINDSFNNQSVRFFPHGTQEQLQFNITAGNNTVNVTTTVQRLLGSNIFLRISEWDVFRGYVSDTGLVGHWAMDEESWNQVAGEVKDQTGANNGTSNGDANTTNLGNFPFYRVGEFDGAGDYINVGNTSTFKFLHGAEDTSAFTFTVEFWVKLNNRDDTQVFVSTGEGDSTKVGTDIFFTDADDQLNMFITRGSVGTFVVVGNSDNNAFPDDNEWHHVAVTYDQALGSDNAKFYVDGVAKGTGTKTANAPSTANSANALHIGILSNLILPLNGSMDDVAIHNRSLSAVEVKQSFVRGLANWDDSVFKNYTDNVGFSISNSTTNIKPTWKLLVGDNNFYSPLLIGNQTYTTFITVIIDSLPINLIIRPSEDLIVTCETSTLTFLPVFVVIVMLVLVYFFSKKLDEDEELDVKTIIFRGIHLTFFVSLFVFMIPLVNYQTNLDMDLPIDNKELSLTGLRGDSFVLSPFVVSDNSSVYLNEFSVVGDLKIDSFEKIKFCFFYNNSVGDNAVFVSSGSTILSNLVYLSDNVSGSKCVSINPGSFLDGDLLGLVCGDCSSINNLSLFNVGNSLFNVDNIIVNFTNPNSDFSVSNGLPYAYFLKTKSLGTNIIYDYYKWFLYILGSFGFLYLLWTMIFLVFGKNGDFDDT